MFKIHFNIIFLSTPTSEIQLTSEIVITYITAHNLKDIL